MANIELIVVAGRVIERLLIVLVGGASLVMGYRLYAMGVVKKQVAEIAHDKTIIRFKDVGPGAFFVVLGTIILATSISNSMILNGENTNNTSKPRSEPASHSVLSISYGNSLSRTIPTVDLVKAATTIIQIVDPEKSSNGVKWKEKGIEQAKSILEKQKRFIMLSEYSQYDEYLIQKKKVLSGGVADFSKIDANTYMQIESYDNSVFGVTP